MYTIKSNRPAKRYFLFPVFFLFLLPLHSSAQGREYDSCLTRLHLKEYSIATKSDTIYFLATVPDKKKATVIFCTGSGPVPLFVKIEGNIYPCFFPVAIDSNTRATFNMVFIAKPGIKRLANPEDISMDLLKHGEVLQLDSMNRPPEKYTVNNNLYKLGGDCIAVIKFLKKQEWVDKDKIYVYGHSQGAHVAAYVAFKDQQDIKGLIYSQGNAYGLYAGYLSKLIYNQAKGQDVTTKMDSFYKLNESIINGIPDKEMAETYQWKETSLFDKKNGDYYDLYYGGWRSLEEPPAIDYLLALNMRILLITGLASPGETDNKNVPLDFARQHKRNLTARFYPGYDHNFFKQVTDEKGNTKEPEFHWGDVFNDVKKWIGK